MPTLDLPVVPANARGPFVVCVAGEVIARCQTREELESLRYEVKASEEEFTVSIEYQIESRSDSEIYLVPAGTIDDENATRWS